MKIIHIYVMIHLYWYQSMFFFGPSEWFAYKTTFIQTRCNVAFGVVTKYGFVFFSREFRSILSTP